MPGLGEDALILRIETEAPESRHAELKASFLAALLDDRPSLRDFVKKGTIKPVVVELLPQGGLPLNPRTGKLIRVIDAID